MIDLKPIVYTPTALALLLRLLAPGVARAQAADPKQMAAAQALYDQASAEMDTNKYESACPKLEEVTRLIPEGLGAKLTLGECYEGQGKLAKAWTEYTRVQELAEQGGQSERARKAASKAAELWPRLSTLTIEVAEPVRSTRGLVITRAGVEVAEGQWGKPMPVDVGEQEVVVTALGHRRRVEVVRVSANGVRLSLEVKPLEQEGSLPPAPSAPPRAALEGGPRWTRTAGFIALGVGAVGVGVGGVLGGLALSTKAQSNAEGHCFANNRCDATGITLRERAGGFADAATGMLIAGGVVLAGGAVVLLTTGAGTEKRAEKQARTGEGRAGWSAAVGLMPGGLSVRGVW